MVTLCVLWVSCLHFHMSALIFINTQNMKTQLLPPAAWRWNRRRSSVASSLFPTWFPCIIRIVIVALLDMLWVDAVVNTVGLSRWSKLQQRHHRHICSLTKCFQWPFKISEKMSYVACFNIWCCFKNIKKQTEKPKPWQWVKPVQISEKVITKPL